MMSPRTLFQESVATKMGASMAVETPSLLIVHQNLNMAKTLATLLAKEFNVYIAKSASQVADLVESNNIQLVLASQQLPDSTGLVLFSQFRLAHPEVIRILLIQDSDRESLNIEDALAGEIIHRYLTEPLRSSHFLSSIRKGIQLYTPAVEADKAPQTESEVPVPAPSLSTSETLPFQEDAPEDVEPISASVKISSAADEVGELKAVSLNYETMQQHQKEVQQALERLEEKQQRIEQLEAMQKQVTEDKDQLLDKILQLQRENAALTVLRRENVELTDEVNRLKTESRREIERLKTEATEEADRLKAQAAQENDRLNTEIDRLKLEAAQEADRLKAQAARDSELLKAESSREIDRLNTEIDRLKLEAAQEVDRLKAQTTRDTELLKAEAVREADCLKAEVAELKEANDKVNEQARAAQIEAGKLREELSSLGMLKGFGAGAPVTTAELQQNIDSFEIYSKAAEWYMQISQLQKLNQMLEMTVHKGEEEVSRLHESMAALRSQIEQDQAKVLKQSRQVVEQYSALKEKSEAREASCYRLQKERDELAQKVLWMQAQWKAKLAHSEEG